MAMAALVDPVVSGPEIVDLRELSGRELDPLLLEESVEWQRELDWDFARSADLVHQFADIRALMGCALIDRGEVVGYGYSVLEDMKGLIGDVYVRPQWRHGNNEVRLFRSILDGIVAVPNVARVESQLMLIEPSVGRALQRERFIRVQERILMRLDVTEPPAMPAGHARESNRFEMWTEHHHQPAAQVIAQAYPGHVDSQINDQYRSIAGARKFIYNIVTFPGCGKFFRQGSFVAFDSRNGQMTGIALTSFVADRVGHITQLCVTPAAKGRGLGYELLRETVEALHSHGARRISLTVTASNREAVALYERCGFRNVRRFLSYVWETSAS
jgi:ribosomal protein S18 acetylase RimI-like enzyme